MGGVQGVRNADADDVQIDIKKMMLQSCACCSAPTIDLALLIGICAAASTMSGIKD